MMVIGVLIALGAEQWVERFHDHQAAAHASIRIKWEIARQRLDALERLAVQPCLTGRLNRLSLKLVAFKGGEWAAMPMNVEQGGVNAAQFSTIPAYRAPERLWVSEAWQTARFQWVLNYRPNATVSAYAQLYNPGDRIRLLQAHQGDAAAELPPLAVDGPLDIRTRASLLAAIAYLYEAKVLVAEHGPLLDDFPEIDNQVAQMLAVERKFRGSCVLPLKLAREMSGPNYPRYLSLIFVNRLRLFRSKWTEVR